MKKKIFPISSLIIFIIVNLFCLNSVLTDPALFHFLSKVSSIGYYYSLLFISLMFVGTGFVCFMKRPNSIVVRKFFYLMYSSGFAIALSVASGLDVSPGRDIEVIAVSFAPYFLMRFFEFFPSSSKPGFFRIIRTSTFLLAATIVITYFTSYPFHLDKSPELLQFIRAAAISNVSLSLMACIILTYLHLKSNSSKVKNQLYTLIASLFISFLPVLFLTLIPGIFHLPNIPFFLSLMSIVLFPVTLAYLLTKQEIIDIKIQMRPLFFEILALLLSLLSINVLFSLFYPFNPAFFYQLNGLMLAILAIFHFIQKLIDPISKRKWRDKAQDIQREKNMIMQQIINGHHLASCARLLIDLIHQTVEINGACLIWKQKQTPKVLYKTGIFSNTSPDEIIRCLNDNNNEPSINEGDYHVFPLENEKVNKGWIIIGQKTNATLFDKNERMLLEKIQSDAMGLLTSTEALSELGQELKEKQSQSLSQEQFNRALLNDREEEQRKLSIYLHDEVLQNVILIANKVEALHGDQQIEDKAYLEIKEYLMNGIYEIREVTRELHPFIVEDLGLEQSLQALKRKLQNNYNVVIQTKYNLNLKVISKKLSIQAYRMIKELLYNAIKHSSSPLVSVSLRSSDHYLILKVKDKGRGFKIPDTLSSLSEKNHLGLITIQKRVDQLNGLLDIESEQNNGTLITITLPLERSDDLEYQHTVSR